MWLVFKLFQVKLLLWLSLGAVIVSIYRKQQQKSAGKNADSKVLPGFGSSPAKFRSFGISEFYLNYLDLQKQMDRQMGVAAGDDGKKEEQQSSGSFMELVSSIFHRRETAPPREKIDVSRRIMDGLHALTDRFLDTAGDDASTEDKGTPRMPQRQLKFFSPKTLTPGGHCTGEMSADCKEEEADGDKENVKPRRRFTARREDGKNSGTILLPRVPEMISP
eukprot:Nk52_evm24s1524 gene=Nk52_evmTU24s1524